MTASRTIPRPAPVRERSASPARRRLARSALIVATLLLIATASIAFALQVTPPQPVSALGQTVEVGAAAPTATTAGPGELMLFGQTLPTAVEFIGPVRPKLVLTDISVNQQLASLFAPGPRPAAERIGDALARGWIRYFLWEVAFVTFAAVLLLGAVAGWRRYEGKRTAVAIAGGLVFVQVVNLSVIMVTAFTAPQTLRQVTSLNDLVGRDEVRAVPRAPGPPLVGVQALVLGDSIAAGLGGPPVGDPSPTDRACERSATAFATTLARVNEWGVRNLACSGATIRSGVLGPQFAGGRWIPPQIAVARRAVEPQVVVVNVGANDMSWSVLVHLCAAAEACDDRAQTAYFQRTLDRFTSDYYDLLRQLVTLRGDPLVVVNQYYAPFGTGSDCLESSGLTGAKIEILLGRLDALNMVLANGAATFGYRTATPNFDGHGLCAEQSYVQDMDAPAPLHPNARGQLVIALATERAILEVDPPSEVAAGGEEAAGRPPA